MAETIGAREANHRFSRILEAVSRGEEFVVTRRGHPVARIVPVKPGGKRQLTAHQAEILAHSMAWLRKGWRLGGKKFDRASLHDR